MVLNGTCCTRRKQAQHRSHSHMLETATAGYMYWLVVCAEAAPAGVQLQQSASHQAHDIWQLSNWQWRSQQQLLVCLMPGVKHAGNANAGTVLRNQPWQLCGAASLCVL